MPGTFTCSEDEDFGSLGDNQVIVINGTSGTPADFASFVIADRAGEAVLLAATAGLSNPDNTLSYPIRPVEKLALLISCIVAGKTAEADYIFITGTDFTGNAQTEFLDVTAGNGTYVTTKYFASISGLDCSDNAAGGGVVWGDGTIRVTQPQWGVIWDYGNSAQYEISAHMNFGNASTSTYFQSIKEMIYFTDGVNYKITSLATLEIGNLQGDWGISGSMWSQKAPGDYDIIESGQTGTFLLYASIHHWRENAGPARPSWRGGTIDVRNSIFSSEKLGGCIHRFYVAVNFQRVYANFMQGLNIYVTPTSIDGLHVHYTTNGIGSGIINATILNGLSTSYSISDWTQWSTARILSVKNPISSILAPYVFIGTGVIKEQYTINIHIVDKDGVNLSGVTVICDDQFSAEQFSEVTDVNGDIAEQILIYKTWTTTSETLVTSSPHVFTFSKPGYQTTIVKNVTVDAPIDWECVLYAQKQPPAPWQEGMM